MTTIFQRTPLLGLFLVLVLSCIGACCCLKDKTSPKLPTQLSEAEIRALGKKIDEVLTEKMQIERLPGVAVVVVQNGRTIYKQGYGLANVQTQQKVHPDSTIFRIGSVSKVLTMMALTKLIDQGQLGYESPVSDYFEGITNPYGLQDTLKIKHLLTHTGGLDQIGLGRQFNAEGLSHAAIQQQRPSLEAFLNDNNVRRIRAAGQQFTYDTYGSTLAGRVIEQVTGLPYPKAMQRLLFEPLGMDATAVEVPPSQRQHLAQGYGYQGRAYTPMPYEHYVTLPASSIDATVADMGRLLEALTSDSTARTLFSPAMRTQVLAPQFRPHPEFAGMTHGLWEGLAFGSRPDGYGVRVLGHGGSMVGTTCNLNLTPELQLGMFVVANRNPESGGGPIALWEVFEAVFEQLGVPKAELYKVPKAYPKLDLEAYVGDYYQGVFCHTCEETAFAAGAWRRGDPWRVEATKTGLNIRGRDYIPREKDLFVREDGQEKLYFGRNEAQQITFFVTSEDATAYERLNK